MPRAKGTPWKVDISGKEYGKWTVISRVAGSLWLCKCACGIEKAIYGSSLTLGKSKGCSSCHSRKHGMEGTSIYNTWASMIQRCENPNLKWYHRYGGRGISVCKRWRESFENFFADMGEKPDKSTLDRKDNNGNYEPNNCRWATVKQQLRNRENTVFLEHEGNSKPLAEWAEHYGISRKLLANRIKQGWSVKDALTKPKSGRWGILKNA